MQSIRRMTACIGILLFTFLLLPLSSCQSKGSEARTFPYDAVVRDLPLREKETALDIVRSKDGYSLLTGIPGQASWITELDSAFQDKGKREKTAARGAVSFAKSDEGVTFFYANSGGEAPTYDLYQNDTIQTKIENVKFENAFCSMNVYDGTLYAAIPAGASGQANCFIIEDRVINSYFGEDEGGVLNTVGFVKYGDTVYAAVNAQKREYIGDRSGFYHITGSDLLLYPVKSEDDGLPQEGTMIELPAQCRACASDGEYLYILSGSYLYRYNGGDLEELYDCVLMGMDETSVVRRMLAVEEGRILILQDNTLLECSVRQGSSETTVLTIGVVNANNVVGDLMSQPVAHYNRKSSGYLYTVKKYKDIEAMNKALLSKEVDVVLSSDLLLMENYAAKGLFADLSELCPELTEEGGILPNVLEASRRNGRLFFLPRAFGIGALTADQEYWGKPFSNDLTAFLQEVKERDPAFYKKMTRRVWFQYAILNHYDNWIDFDAGSAHFGDPSFAACLESCLYASRDAAEYEANQQAKSHLFYGYIYEPLSILSFAEDASYRSAACPLECVLPLPTTAHKGFSISPDHYFAVVEKDVNPDEISRFIHYYFLETTIREDFLDMTEFSVRTEELRTQVEEAESLSEEAEMDESYRKAVEDVKEKTYRMIEEADYLDRPYKDVISAILVDEAERYFAGEITAEQAAEYIQDRVSIYLAEQG